MGLNTAKMLATNIDKKSIKAKRISRFLSHGCQPMFLCIKHRPANKNIISRKCISIIFTSDPDYYTSCFKQIMSRGCYFKTIMNQITHAKLWSNPFSRQLNDSTFCDGTSGRQLMQVPRALRYSPKNPNHDIHFFFSTSGGRLSKSTGGRGCGSISRSSSFTGIGLLNQPPGPVGEPMGTTGQFHTGSSLSGHRGLFTFGRWLMTSSSSPRRLLWPGRQGLQCPPAHREEFYLLACYR